MAQKYADKPGVCNRKSVNGCCVSVNTENYTWRIRLNRNLQIQKYQMIFYSSI